MDNLQPKILFEDDYFAILEKPAGLIVNRADTVKDIETFQDFVENNIKLNRKDLDRDEEFKSRSGIVHRLDKETSGLLIVAKDAISFQVLKNQFKEGRVEKTYFALSHGKITPEEGEINAPVGRLPWNRERFGVLSEGRQALTFYKVIEYKILKVEKKEEQLTYLELHPKTGRTHQIRVHLKYLGYPIFADPFYAGRKTARSDRKFLNRHFLHAAKIKFFHPKTDQTIEFESQLPPELQSFLNSLSSAS